MFLYSQDLSNCTTPITNVTLDQLFLYSQDLSNCTTKTDSASFVESFCTLKI